MDTLRDFVSLLERKKELKRIAARVSPELEISEIVNRVCKASGPALLFENVSGFDYPVAANLFGSDRRLELAFGRSPARIADELDEFMQIAKSAGILDAFKSIPKLAKLAHILPQKSARAQCQEVEAGDNLETLPALRCWPLDGGRFLTLPQVITRDPETGAYNMGMYRMQIYDRDRAGLHWHLHKDGHAMFEKYKRRGEKMPVAVALGCDPATVYAATAPLPGGVSEYLFSGFIRNRPLELTCCKTCELMVPAHAEFILEGYVDPMQELQIEGPFGDHTGYYSETGLYPEFHLRLITRRKHPVFPATVVGAVPSEDCFIGRATGKIFLPLIRANIPELSDISFPLEGVFHGCAVLSINKKYPGQSFKVMNAVWGMGQLMFTKNLIVVDDDINPADYSRVAHRVFNNLDPARDLLVVKGPLDALDHASDYKHFGHKLGIDATRKLSEEAPGRPRPAQTEMPDFIVNLVSGRWCEYGF